MARSSTLIGNFKKSSLLQQYLANLLFLSLLILTISHCTLEEKILFDPPSGAYDEPQDVVIRLQGVPAGTAFILFTSDGSTPNPERCTIPYDGSPIHISQTVQLKAIFVKDNGFISEVETAEYTIAGGGGPDITNKAALLEWMDYEDAVANWFFCEFNNCAQPGMANFCNNDRSCLPYRINQYDSAGNITGFINLDAEAVISDMAGRTTITYENFRLSSELTAVVVDNDPIGTNILYPAHIPAITYDLTATGVLVGTFKLDGSGHQSTTEDGGVNIVTSGDFTAEIEDHTFFTEYVRTSGYFVVTCSDPGCGAGPQIYLAPDWELLVGSDIEDSCPPPYYLIVNQKYGNKCLTSTAGETIASDCNPDDPNQQWLIEPTGTAPFTNGDVTEDLPAYRIMARDGSYCFQDDSVDTWGGNNPYTTLQCTPGNNLQRWLFLFVDEQGYFRMRDVEEEHCPHIGWFQDTNLFEPIAPGCPGWFDEIYWGLLKEGIYPLVNPNSLPQE